MTKKRSKLAVRADLSDLFDAPIGSPTQPPHASQNAGLPIQKALEIVVEQMETAGLRSRTIIDYELHVSHFAKVTRLVYLPDMSAASVYEWLGSMQVSAQTRLTRLKCLRAFLERCADNGWLTDRWWRQISIRVDTPVKEGATDNEVFTLLRLLDLSDFVQLRDAAAVLVLYQTGIRLATISALEERHIDLDARILRLEGAIIKNRETLVLPFDERLARLLSVLLEQNAIIRRENGVSNNYVFITQNGTAIKTSHTANNIAKRLNVYKRKYGLKNINAHALRRGFAKSIYNRSGGDLALVSKALGHSDFAVTARYLHLDAEEVADKLRTFL